MDRDPQWRFLAACKKCDTDEVRHCLDGEYGSLSANEEIQTHQGFLTPLTCACYESSYDSDTRVSSEHRLATVTLLLDRGADVNKLSSHGGLGSPLHAACDSCRVNIELLRLLLTRGADVDLVGHGKRTPLLELCSKLDTTLPAETKLLLDHGADPNRMWGNGSVLHEAAFTWAPGRLRVGQLSVVRLLLEYGADVNYGWRLSHDSVSCQPHSTPLERAEDPQIKKLFRKYLTILVRKHVIGPPAEHPSRRIEHQAPLIASFLV